MKACPPCVSPSSQVDPTVGDLAGNAELVRGWTRKAAEAGAQLVLFPEMMLTGYPVEDLVFRRSFVAASRAAVQRLAADLAADGLGELPVVVGYLDADGPAQVSAGRRPGRGARNAAAAAARRPGGGHRYFKHHLPNYGVFDEDRYFVPGDTLTVVRIGGVDIALTICEDIWQAGGPFAVARRAGVGLVVNINGSPYELNKDDVRLPLVRRRAAEAGAAVAYVNMVGGQDELVFDGDSMIVARRRRAARPGRRSSSSTCSCTTSSCRPRPTAAGRRRRCAGRHADRATATLDGIPPRRPVRPRTGGADRGRVADEAEVWQALVLGPARLRPQERVPVGGARPLRRHRLGGGGRHRRRRARAGPGGRGVACPASTPPSTPGTDAADLAQRTGLDYRVEPIQPMVDGFLANLSLSGVAVENLQARVRGVILMALSNQEGHLVLTTGNKSELAVGYSTLYGDSVGGFNPVKDVWKTLVWRLAKWRNADAARRGETAPIPENSIGKPPSAELSPGQLDSDSAAGLRRAGPDPDRLRRRRPGPRRAGRSRVTTRRWWTGCCGWWTPPSTSGGSRRRARRSP